MLKATKKFLQLIIDNIETDENFSIDVSDSAVLIKYEDSANNEVSLSFHPEGYDHYPVVNKIVKTSTRKVFKNA